MEEKRERRESQEDFAFGENLFVRVHPRHSVYIIQGTNSMKKNTKKRKKNCRWTKNHQNYQTLEKKAEEGPCPLYNRSVGHLIVIRLKVRNGMSDRLVIRRTRTSERKNQKETRKYDITSNEEMVAKELHQERPNGSHSDWLKKNQNNG